MQPGEVSNLIEAEASFHILKLERRIPADEAKFEDVRAHLEDVPVQVVVEVDLAHVREAGRVRGTHEQA
ncbi:hypothetical protein D3C83_169040 [compost metagenome]